MLIFKSIKWKNFLSTGNMYTKIELNKASTTLIIGKNGSGKSTLLDALTFVLFGKPFRKINKPQLVNAITKKDLVVEIEFSIGSNNYRVMRGMKPAVFEIFQNNKLLEQTAEVKDYQEIIEKQILKVNYKSFCQIVILGTANFQPFMQLAAAQRRDIIEDLLDLQIFGIMNTLLKEKIQANTSTLQKLGLERKSLEEKISLIKKHLKEAETDTETLINEKQASIEKNNEIIEQHQKDLEGINLQIITIETELKSFVDFDKKSDKLKLLKSKIEIKIESLNKDIKFFEKHNNCPTCQQNIDSDFRSNIVLERKSEIEKVSEGLALLIKEQEDVSIQLQKRSELLSKLNQSKLDKSISITMINNRLETNGSLGKEINKLRGSVRHEDNVSLVDFQNQLSLREKEYLEESEYRGILSSLAILLKDDGIKSKIIRQYVPIINKTINTSLQAMNFFVQFELDENFNESIKSRYRDEFSYESFSEGEKQRINLAILFTWRSISRMRNSINTNLLILDEVFDSSLDSDVTEDFMSILKNNLTDTTNTFIISHKTDQLVDKFDETIRFQKVKNFSKKT